MLTYVALAHYTPILLYVYACGYVLGKQWQSDSSWYPSWIFTSIDNQNNCFSYSISSFIQRNTDCSWINFRWTWYCDWYHIQFHLFVIHISILWQCFLQILLLFTQMHFFLYWKENEISSSSNHLITFILCYVLCTKINSLHDWHLTLYLLLIQYSLSWSFMLMMFWFNLYWIVFVVHCHRKTKTWSLKTFKKGELF